MCIVEFTGHLLSDRDTTSSTGMAAGVNGNNQWEWEGNGNKIRLNLGLGMGMGINHWEWEGMGLKKMFPVISSSAAFSSLIAKASEGEIVENALVISKNPSIAVMPLIAP